MGKRKKSKQKKDTSQGNAMALFTKSEDGQGVWFKVPLVRGWKKQMRNAIPRAERFWDAEHGLWWVSRTQARAFFDVCTTCFPCGHNPNMVTPKSPTLDNPRWKRQILMEAHGSRPASRKVEARVDTEMRVAQRENTRQELVREQYAKEHDRRYAGGYRIRDWPPPGVPVLLWATDEARHYLSDQEWHAEEELWSFPRITPAVMERMVRNLEVEAEEEYEEPGYRLTSYGYQRYRSFTCGEPMPKAWEDKASLQREPLRREEDDEVLHSNRKEP